MDILFHLARLAALILLESTSARSGSWSVSRVYALITP